VLNLEPTIAYTETYVAAADTSATGAAAQSIGELMKRPAHSWEDSGHTVPTMPARCLAELRAAFPQLFGGAERKREAEQVCAADKTEAPRDLKAVTIEEVPSPHNAYVECKVSMYACDIHIIRSRYGGGQRANGRLHLHLAGTNEDFRCSSRGRWRSDGP
jgi:hypothetical protein